MGAIGPSAHSVSRQFEMTYWRDSHFGQNASIRSRSGGPARAACPRTRFRSIPDAWIVPASPSRRVRPPNGR